MPAHIVVLYNPPKDPAAFEKYYAAMHIPILQKHAKEIGFTEAKFVKFSSGLDGSPAPIYRKAELVFASMAALRQGVATNGFKQVGADLANFASGGVTALLGEETT